MAINITASGNLKRAVNLLLMLSSGVVMSTVSAVELYSAHIDREAEKIIIKGSGFQQSTTVELAGVGVIKGNVTDTQLEIPFAAEIYSVVQYEANYNLVIDGSNSLSLYIEKPILAPPPPGGPDCPCLNGWNTIPLSPDSLWCQSGVDGTQSFVYGQDLNGGDLFISAAFDPNNIYFDSNNPNNSISFCSWYENNEYQIVEPIVNEDQYLDCYGWISSNSACLFPP